MATKPSRSDEVLDADEQTRIANQVRDQFDSIAPKRPTKPNRSESDSPAPPIPSDETIPLPEFEKFRSLQSQSQSQAIVTGANGAQDDFVETQYYNQLNSVDKQHHTTGSGFIKMVGEIGGDGYDLQLQSHHESEGFREMMMFRTNPATNDWIPSSIEDDGVGFVSSKPNRSESG